MMSAIRAAGIGIFLLAMVFNASAQILRIQTGINLADMAVSPDQDTRKNAGLQLGLTGELTLSHILSMEAGICRSPKGFKIVAIIESDGSTTKEKYLFNANYADIFVNAKGSYFLDDIRLTFSAGPYLGIGVGGRHKTITYVNGEKVSTSFSDISWGSDDQDDIRRYDFGLSFGAGCEYKAIQLQLFYQFGLPDVCPGNALWEGLKNRLIGISAGFRIGG